MVSSDTVLITGAGGFIGLNTVKAFVNKGFIVTALVNKNIPDELKKMSDVTLIQADMTNKEDINSVLKNLSFDFVVHIAGLASDIGSDELFRKINFEPVKIFSEFAKKKFIYLSSSDVYGIKDFHGEKEDELHFEENPINPYPKYKIESEKWITSHLLPSEYVLIRPAAVWGEGDKTLEKRVVDFLRTSPFIVNFGKWRGKNRWPLANVQNVSDTIVAVCLTNEFDGTPITIIDEKHTSIEEYYREIAKKYFSDKKFITLNLPMWVGLLLGWVSTTMSNIFGKTRPIFDPSFYAVHHVSSNLDFNGERMQKALETLKKAKS